MSLRDPRANHCAIGRVMQKRVCRIPRVRDIRNHRVHRVVARQHQNLHRLLRSRCAISHLVEKYLTVPPFNAGGVWVPVNIPNSMQSRVLQLDRASGVATWAETDLKRDGEGIPMICWPATDP